MREITEKDWDEITSEAHKVWIRGLESRFPGEYFAPLVKFEDWEKENFKAMFKKAIEEFCERAFEHNLTATWHGGSRYDFLPGPEDPKEGK